MGLISLEYTISVGLAEPLSQSNKEMKLVQAGTSGYKKRTPFCELTQTLEPLSHVQHELRGHAV
nr:MAG TPA: hypothetical protein [Caudoviricetes sp.]